MAALDDVTPIHMFQTLAAPHHLAFTVDPTGGNLPEIDGRHWVPSGKVTPFGKLVDDDHPGLRQELADTGWAWTQTEAARDAS